jgi:hypothetical protein
MARIIDREGKNQEVSLSLEDYAQAYAEGKSFAQHINAKFDTDEAKYGKAFDQVLASSGIFVREDRATGLRPPTMAEMFATGGNQINAGTLTRNEGNARDTTLGRLLFPSIVLEMMNAYLLEDNSSYEGAFMQMVAKTTSVDSPRWTQPLIDVTAPRAEDSNPISQNSEPRSMVSISLSEKSYKIPTFSIGLSITDEASRATTLDLVSIALKEQAIGERGRLIDAALKKMVLGDTDLGIAALTGATNSSAYDSTATSLATFSHKAYVLWLRSEWKKLSIDTVICDLPTYWAIENRVGKPTWISNESTDGRLNSAVTIKNPNIVGNVNYFIVEDASLIGGTGKLIGLDSKRAIHRVVYSGASYSAVENFVLRKSSSYRFDWSESFHRMLNNNDGWKVLQIA